MKGFPNQISNLSKLSSALKIASDLASKGVNVRDDGDFGEALVRGGVAGTGHVSMPVDAYLAAQRLKKTSNQSFRTTARGLRELFAVLGVADGNGKLTQAGSQIVASWNGTLTPQVLDLWRTVIRNMTHDGNYGGVSHPYQVLLRLVARVPGIPRAKCPLALEAKDDSDSELERIVELSKKSEADIIQSLGVTQTNWDNAKKILPAFAEQLGDVRKTGQSFTLATVPGAEPPDASGQRTTTAGTGRSGRRSRSVTKQNIATAGTVESFDEQDEGAEATVPTPEEVAARNARLADRLRRHNLLVQKVARICEEKGAALFEDPYDCLSEFSTARLLMEIKTLDGSESDEVHRVREALSQLLYYESFAANRTENSAPVIKIAVFERGISPQHAGWLAQSSIHVLSVRDAGGFHCSRATAEAIKDYWDDSLTIS